MLYNNYYKSNIWHTKSINNQINIYIPEVELMDVTADKSPDSHTLFIKIDYRMVINEEQDSILINFNTNETDDSAGYAQTNSAGY